MVGVEVQGKASVSSGILGRNSVDTGTYSNGADAKTLPNGPPPNVTKKTIQCPECSSSKVFRNGALYSNFDVKIQRYICRSCGRRFSDPDDLKKAKQVAGSCLSTLNLKIPNTNIDNSQVCVEEAKNLTHETPKEISVSLGEQQPQTKTGQAVKADVNLVIADYKQYIQKEHKVNNLTLSKYVYRLKALAHEFNVDLFNPDDFKKPS